MFSRRNICDANFVPVTVIFIPEIPYNLISYKLVDSFSNVNDI